MNGVISAFSDRSSDRPGGQPMDRTGTPSSSKKAEGQGAPSVVDPATSRENGSSSNVGSSSKVIPKSSPAHLRLQKEFMSMATKPPEGVVLDEDTVQGSNLSLWKIRLKGPPGSLYDGEKFLLQFKFDSKYPFDSPEVTFVGNCVPVHPHVYSNGHICLSILTEDWSPALSVETVCLSVISMLSSAKEKKLPPDNSIYVRTCHKNPKKTRWWYHDDKV